MTLEEMQFGALMLTGVLTIDLLSHAWMRNETVYNRSRWFFVCGIGICAIQFFLQYFFHIRAHDPVEGIAVNIVFFEAGSCLVVLALLNLLRQGHVSKLEYSAGGICWLISTAILAMGYLLDSRETVERTDYLRASVYEASIIFSFMELVYVLLLLREMSKMRRALNSYYDTEERDSLLGWMQRFTCYPHSAYCCLSASSSQAICSCCSPSSSSTLFIIV